MRAGELAAAAGVNVETLRYYERRGLLPEPPRSPGGFREYDDDALVLLRVVKAAQRLGFTLDEVSDLLATGRRRRHPPPDLQTRARAKLAEVQARIADLELIRDGLEQVIDARCDSLTDCTCQDCPLPFVELSTLCLVPGLMEGVKPGDDEQRWQPHGSTPTSCGNAASGWCWTRRPTRPARAPTSAAASVSSWASARKRCAVG